MKTKYDWSGVPSHIIWIATDADSAARGHNRKPVIDHPEEWHSDQYYNYPIIGYDLYQGNWQDSLEERPNDL